MLPHQQSTPNMTLYVEAGIFYIGNTRVIFAGGNSPSFTAPTTNPRIDILTIDSAGTLAITQGTEAASPSVPTYPTDKIVICEVYNRVGETSIKDTSDGTNGYISNDTRPTLWAGLSIIDAQISSSAQIQASKIRKNSDMLPETDNTYDLGSASFRWAEVRAVSLYGDGSNITGVGVTASGTAGEAINASSTPQVVYLSKTNGKWYKAVANDRSKILATGIVAGGQNVAADASVTVTLFPCRLSGFSVTQGDEIYLSDTAGAVSSGTPGTYFKHLGRAESASVIIFSPQFTSRDDDVATNGAQGLMLLDDMINGETSSTDNSGTYVTLRTYTLTGRMLKIKGIYIEANISADSCNLKPTYQIGAGAETDFATYQAISGSAFAWYSFGNTGIRNTKPDEAITIRIKIQDSQVDTKKIRNVIMRGEEYPRI